MPAPLLPQGTLDFTGLTREDMLMRLQTLFNQVNPEWDDFSSAHPENLLLEGMTFITDIIRGTMEERVRQINWATVTDRLAAIRLGRLGAFTLTGAAAASLTGTFSISSGIPHSKDIPIPVGTRVITGTSSTPARYRVTSVGSKIAIGGTSVTVSLEQAEEVSETFQTNSEPSIELVLDQSPYIDGSAVVVATDGTYTESTSFLGVSATVKAFVVLIDDEGIARLRFGSGINGSIPQGNIVVTYKVGGGAGGEVNAAASWLIEDDIVDTSLDPIPTSFTNSAASGVGIDAMTVDEARVRGPLSLRTISRMVNQEDFETIATSVPGIARAFMATSEDDSGIGEDNGRLLLVAVGTQLASGRFSPAVPTDAKIAEVTVKLSTSGDTPPVMGFTFIETAAELLTVNVEVRIFKKANAIADDVSVAIQASLDDFFAVTLADGEPNIDIDFGAKLLGSDGQADFQLLWSSVFNAILDSEGVRYISSSANNLLLNGAHSSVFVSGLRFPVLGTVTILDMDQAGLSI